MPKQEALFNLDHWRQTPVATRYWSCLRQGDTPLPAIARYQNRNRIASWLIRGSRAEVTCPKAAAPNDVFTPANCVWLKRLKNSARNCTATRSVIAVRLMNETSQLLIPGARNSPRPALPNVPNAGFAKELVLNQRETVLLSVTGAIRSGRCAPPPTPARSAGIVTVAGVPDSNREMPESCQP